MISSELQYHWLWQDKPYAKGQAWIDLVLMSEKENFYIRNKNYNLPNGQLAISEPGMEKRWGWSRTKIRSFLCSLEEASLIKIKRHSGMTEITILSNSYIQISEQKNIQQEIQEEKQDKKQLKSLENNDNPAIQKQQKKQAEIQQKNNENNKEETAKQPEIIQKTIFDTINENF